jgi:hypothetical protein
MGWCRREDLSLGLILLGMVGLGMLFGCHSRRQKDEPPTVPKPVPGPQIAGCPVFPADNVWNTRVDDLPKDPHSDEYIDGVGVTERLHADFGPEEGIPITVMTADASPATVRFQYDAESDHVPYPFPWGVAIEGGPNAGGDRHIIVVDPKNCMLYEWWHAYQGLDRSWTAGAGMRMDLRSNALRPAGWTSADAAGLPILPGLARWDEVAAGEIRHALRFTLPKTEHAYVWPARHQAGVGKGSNLPPMGLRLRLRADFKVSRYPPMDRVILIALQRYGMILADNGAAIFITGEPNVQWDLDELHQLRSVMGQDFEVVDESGLQVSPDSGAVRKTVVSSK